MIPSRNYPIVHHSITIIVHSITDLCCTWLDCVIAIIAISGSGCITQTWVLTQAARCACSIAITINVCIVIGESQTIVNTRTAIIVNAITDLYCTWMYSGAGHRRKIASRVVGGLSFFAFVNCFQPVNWTGSRLMSR